MGHWRSWLLMTQRDRPSQDLKRSGRLQGRKLRVRSQIPGRVRVGFCFSLAFCHSFSFRGCLQPILLGEPYCAAWGRAVADASSITWVTEKPAQVQTDSTGSAHQKEFLFACPIQRMVPLATLKLCPSHMTQGGMSLDGSTS